MFSAVSLCISCLYQLRSVMVMIMGMSYLGICDKGMISIYRLSGREVTEELVRLVFHRPLARPEVL